MDNPRSRRRAPILIAVSAVLVAAAAGAYFLFLRPPEPPPVFARYTEGDLLYQFHIPTGSEELFDTKADPDHRRNLARARPEDTARLRRLLTENLNIKDLEELRKGSVIEGLRGLQYLD